MSDSISSITAATNEQTQAMMAILMQQSQQQLQAQVAMQLIQSVVQPTGAEFQDPSTITPEQLQSPIDLRI